MQRRSLLFGAGGKIGIALRDFARSRFHLFGCAAHFRHQCAQLGRNLRERLQHLAGLIARRRMALCAQVTIGHSRGQCTCRAQRRHDQAHAPPAHPSRKQQREGRAESYAHALVCCGRSRSVDTATGGFTLAGRQCGNLFIELDVSSLHDVDEAARRAQTGALHIKRVQRRLAKFGVGLLQHQQLLSRCVVPDRQVMLRLDQGSDIAQFAGERLVQRVDARGREFSASPGQ